MEVENEEAEVEDTAVHVQASIGRIAVEVHACTRRMKEQIEEAEADHRLRGGGEVREVRDIIKVVRAFGCNSTAQRPGVLAQASEDVEEPDDHRHASAVHVTPNQPRSGVGIKSAVLDAA